MVEAVEKFVIFNSKGLQRKKGEIFFIWSMVLRLQGDKELKRCLCMHFCSYTFLGFI